MFKWTSFYNFLEFHCKILNSYAIYRCKKMVKILNCYLFAKKVMALCLREQFFLANPVYSIDFCLIRFIIFAEKAWQFLLEVMPIHQKR